MADALFGKLIKKLLSYNRDAILKSLEELRGLRL